MRLDRDLFGKRLVKPPPASEFAVHCLIADILERWKTPGWLVTHFPAGELRDKAIGGRLKRMGMQRGWSDFILVAPPQGRFHALELKRKGAKPTPEQTAFLEAVRAIGGEAVWVDSFERAIEVLMAWGALRTKVTP